MGEYGSGTARETWRARVGARRPRARRLAVALSLFSSLEPNFVGFISEDSAAALPAS